MGLAIFPDHLGSPIEHGVVTKFAFSKDFFFLQRSSEFGLVSSHATDPHIMLGDDRFHGKHLIEIATMIRVVDEEEFALFIPLTAFRNRRLHINDPQSHQVCYRMPEGHRLREMEAGIQEINRDLWRKSADNMQQWETVRLEG